MTGRNQVALWVSAWLVLLAVQPAQGIVAWSWLTLLCLSALWLSSLLGKRFGVWTAMAFVWSNWSALWAGFASGKYFGLVSPEDQVAFLTLGNDSALGLLLVGAVAVSLPPSWPSQAMAALPWVAVGDAVWTCLQAISTPQTMVSGWGGLIGNPSMHGCFLAVLMPLAVRRFGWPVGVLLLAAILLGRASVPILALGAPVLLWAGWWAAPFALVGAGALAFDPQPLSSNGRMAVWQDMVQWWLDQPDWLMGKGGGTARIWLIEAGHPSFWSLHNDWLQIGIEQGMIGLALTLCAYAVALWRSRRRSALLSALLACGATATMNWPLRCAPFTLLIACLMASACSRQDAGGCPES